MRDVADVTAAKRTIAALVKDAIHVEQAGLSVPKRAPDDDEGFGMHDWESRPKPRRRAAGSGP